MSHILDLLAVATRPRIERMKLNGIKAASGLIVTKPLEFRALQMFEIFKKNSSKVNSNLKKGWLLY